MVNVKLYSFGCHYLPIIFKLDLLILVDTQDEPFVNITRLFLS